MSLGDFFEKAFSWLAPRVEEPDTTVSFNKSSNVANLPVIYGNRKITGTRPFVVSGDKTGGNNKKNAYIYMVIALCEGEVEAIDDIWLDDKHISEFDTGDYSVSTVGSFASYTNETAVVIRKYLGTDSQTADSMLQNATGWTASHRLRGIAYLAVRLKYTEKYFGGAPPVISCSVRGRKVRDIRQSPATEVYTDNAALCLLDYLTNTRYGKGLPDSAINMTAFSTAADDCDTTTTVTPLQTLGTPDLVSTVGDHKYMAWYTAPANGQVLPGATLQTGDSPVSKTGVVVSGFSTPGWFGNNGGLRIAFEMTAGADFTASDEVFTTGDAHSLYACNAVIDTGETLFDNVKHILTGMRGQIPFVQGQYAVEVEQARTSDFSFNESHIIGGISVQLPQKKDKYNRVTAKFSNPNANWEDDIAVFPEPGSATETALLAEDGDTPLHHEVTLDAVNNYYQAHDLARLILYKSRANIRCSFRTTSEALQLTVGQVVDVTHPTPGWAGKLFQITQMGLQANGEVALDLTEHTPSIYNPDIPNPDLLKDNTNLPDPFDVQTPTNLSAASLNDRLAGGLIRSGIVLDFDSSDDGFTDRYEVQYRNVSESPNGAWQAQFTTETSITLIPLDWGNDYELRVRTITTLGSKSDWSATLTHTLSTDTTAPGVPTIDALSSEGAFLIIDLTPPSDLDFSHYQLFASTTDSIPGTPTVDKHFGNRAYIVGTTATTWYVWAKAVDDSGNVGTATASSSTTTGAPAGSVTVSLFSPTEPVGTYENGTLWFDESDNNNMHRYDDTQSPPWVDVHDSRIASALASANNAQATADGRVHSFAQDLPPVDANCPEYATTGKGLGIFDVWVETDDDNELHFYRPDFSPPGWYSYRDGTIATAQATADAKPDTYRQSTAPASPKTGDIWIDTSGTDTVQKRYNGSTWDKATGLAGQVDLITNNLLDGTDALNQEIILGTLSEFHTDGKTSYGSATAGFWLGYDGGAYKFDFGDSSEYIRWDGSVLSISGILFTGSGSTGSTGVGRLALDAETTGFGNTAFGSSALTTVDTGRNNVGVGASAGQNIAGGQDNIAIGVLAGNHITTGDRNTIVGYNAGTSGNTSYNICIGFNAGEGWGTGDDNIIIGTTSSGLGSDKLYIHNAATTRPLLYGDFSARTLTLHGDVTISDDDAGSNGDLTVEGDLTVTGSYNLAASDIPSLDTSKLTTGILGTARGGTGTTSTTGTGSVVFGTSPTIATPTLTGNVQLSDKLVHTGDTDTYYQFTTGNAALVCDGATVYNTSSTEFVAYVKIRPSTDEAIDLGTSTRAWNVIHYATLTQSSDGRGKEGVTEIAASFALDLIDRIQWSEYNTKAEKARGENRRRWGVVAQQAEAALRGLGMDPDALGLVSRGEGGDYGVSYIELIPILAAGVKELSRRVEALERG